MAVDTALERKPDAGPANPGDDTSKLAEYKAWFRADREHSASWRKQAKEDFDFLAGEQWSEQDKATLKEQLRPIITFNRTNPIINAISGMEIQNRQEVKYFPREFGDAAADEVLTSAASGSATSPMPTTRTATCSSTRACAAWAARRRR
jgi:hypothetical protein